MRRAPAPPQHTKIGRINGAPRPARAPRILVTVPPPPPAIPQTPIADIAGMLFTKGEDEGPVQVQTQELEQVLVRLDEVDDRGVGMTMAGADAVLGAYLVERVHVPVTVTFGSGMQRLVGVVRGLRIADAALYARVEIDLLGQKLLQTGGMLAFVGEICGTIEREDGGRDIIDARLRTVGITKHRVRTRPRPPPTQDECA